MRIISGEKKGMRLFPLPKGVKTRPTEDQFKENLFNILGPLDPSDRVLDLFAGTGQIGLEFLSRGAGQLVFCEKDRKMSRLLQENLAKTGYVDRALVYATDFRLALKNMEGPFSYIYLDPPFGLGMEDLAVEKILDRGLLAQEGKLLLEAAMDKGQEEARPFPGLQAVFFRPYGRKALSIYQWEEFL